MDNNQPYTGVEWYTCGTCSGKFTYKSGLIDERICSVCRSKELDALNKADEERRDSIMQYEISLYGENVYFAYLLEAMMALDEDDKTFFYNTMFSLKGLEDEQIHGSV